MGGGGEGKGGRPAYTAGGNLVPIIFFARVLNGSCSAGSFFIHLTHMDAFVFFKKTWFLWLIRERGDEGCGGKGGKMTLAAGPVAAFTAAPPPTPPAPSPGHSWVLFIALAGNNRRDIPALNSKRVVFP